MGYQWSAGEEVTAAKLNQTGGSPTSILWFGQLYANYTGEYAVLTGGGRYLWTPEAANTMYLYDAMKADNAFPRTQTTTVGSLTIDPRVAISVYDGATEYVIAAAYGGTALYRYDADDFGNETLITISGVSLTDEIRRIGYSKADGEVYIQDATSLAGTRIHVFTFAGSTLTWDRTITLDTAPGSGGNQYSPMHIGANYLTLTYGASDSEFDLMRYNKSTGALVDTWSGYDAATSQQASATVVNVDTNDLYIITEPENATTGSMWLIKITPDSVA